MILAGNVQSVDRVSEAFTRSPNECFRLTRRWLQASRFDARRYDWLGLFLRLTLL